jgi:hypothetical protein
MTDADRVRDERERIQTQSARTNARATVWVAVCSVATLGLTLSTFLILRGQLTVMERQLDAMRGDQRPYIVISPDKDGPGRDTGGSVSWNYNFENLGKSTALNTRQVLVFKVGDSVSKWGWGGLAGGSIRPTEKGYATATAEGKFSAADFARLRVKDGGIVLLVEVAYSDSFGAKYSDGFCHILYSNGSVGTPEPATCR